MTIFEWTPLLSDSVHGGDFVFYMMLANRFSLYKSIGLRYETLRIK